MNRFKKALSVGMSAALLASLFATAAAPAAFAAPPGTASVGSAGSVPRAGTSAGATTFTFTEAAINDWNGTGTLTVTIVDSAGNPTVSFTGTPTLVAPDSLGASVAVGTNSFTVTTTDFDPLNAEQFSVQGLKIKAVAGAALGAIKTTYAGTGVFSGYFDAPPKATGTLVNTVFAGNTSALVNVTSVCDFAVSGGGNGDLALTSPAETKAISAVTANVGGQQTLTIAALASGHAAGTAVSQTLAACAAALGVLASAGTVVDSLALTVEDGPFGVQPGLFNQEIGTFRLSERTAPFLTAGTVISATITTAGVVWSNAIDANTHALAGTEFELVNETSTLSADRKTVTWTVATASTAGSAGYMHENGTWNVDVAANAVLGATVDVTVTAGSLLVTPTSVTIGYINNVIAGTAAAPTVYIGENDQQTGMVTIREAAIGSFTAGGTNNVFSVTLEGPEFFTRAPVAVVTASNLKLLNPATLLGVTSLPGVLSNGNKTATWTIYSASTDVPAMIDIRGTDATGAVLPAGPLNGVRINVNAGAPIGTVNLNIASGTATDQTDFAILAIAVRAFRSGVVVTALSQPTIPKGSADSLGGDITITETLTGQFRSGQDICVVILPRSGNFFIQDTFLKTANTNDRPVITATPGSGLVVGPVTPDCGEEFSSFANTTNSFSFSVLQQAFAPNLGKITISNIHYITVADAPTGAVLVSVSGDSDNNATAFQTIVSNATIGTPAPFAFNVTGTALGNTLTGPFTPSTKISRGGYITWRFDGGAAAAGKTIEIWAYKKVGLFTNPWSAPYLLTTRVANANGVAFANIRSGSVIWLSIRPVLPATATTPAVWGPWSIGRWIR